MTTDLNEKKISAKPDGRKLRTDDSRQKIVSAFLQLIREGTVAPSAECVARAANVGLRTVFRRFKEMELLYREMIIELQNKFAPEVVKPWKTTGVENQLQEMLERKAIIYEDLMPYRIASSYHKYHSEFIKHSHKHWNEIEQKSLESILPFKKSSEPVLFNAIEVALSFDTWLQLRVDHNINPEQSYDTMKLSLSALLQTYNN
ncbi:TetR/AcrR family transcriptional regulator [Colwellia demingiae]|uniref:TetR/AcrR family transcriptional regulator n=1 Tax=Colwellia demingiae TaxID=89401 RepID=A0A5C6QGF9_9GAMM|nr:TetR/AcrR family transcriptional regulator [Colwellia demingiae]TWX68075.1 TetR/AcrR family transcriptional regulator [Colwellia demingiae]